MADLTPYYEAIAVGSTVNDAVNNLGEAAKAAGYAAFINSITGDVPYVYKIPGTNRARLVLNANQVAKIQQWLDQQVAGAFRSGPPPVVEYELGPALKPWALKYALPSAGALLVVGIVAGYFLKSYLR